MPDRNKLPIGRYKIAMLAKDIATQDPSKMDFDDSAVPWVFHKESGWQISFMGNYSSDSATQRRENLQREKKFYVDAARLDYIENAYWSMVRQDIVKRDKNTCRMCGVEGGLLHIHHILKKRHGGTDRYDNLLLVCPKCHAAADKKLYDPE